MSGDTWNDPYWDEDYEIDPWQEALECGDLPCEHGVCGPACGFWMGDGLCELVIERQVEQREKHFASCYVKDARCPVCEAELERFTVRGEKLWGWDPSWYDAMIGLEVYHPLWVPKGEIHHRDDVYHVWIGEGEGRLERLIQLEEKEGER